MERQEKDRQEQEAQRAREELEQEQARRAEHCARVERERETRERERRWRESERRRSGQTKQRRAASYASQESGTHWSDPLPSFTRRTTHLRDAKMVNAYILLGLDLERVATQEEIRAAYKKAALRAHPDRPHNSNRQEEATAEFQRVKAAFDLVVAKS